MPKVSIITATRNRPDFLRRCILAIQKQDWDDYEHIVVGDHCDYAKRVVDEFKNDSHIRYAKTPEPHVHNHGASGKNRGIEVARGKYVAYCDDDNILLPSHTRILYEELEKGYDVVFTQFYALSIPHGAQRTKKILSVDLNKLLTDEEFIKNHSDQASYLTNTQLSDIDMLSCGHRKDIYPHRLKWPTVAERGPNEDGYLMSYIGHRHTSVNGRRVLPPMANPEGLGLVNNPNLKINYIAKGTAIYSAGGGSRDADTEYDEKFKNLKGLYVYPDILKKGDING